MPDRSFYVSVTSDLESNECKRFYISISIKKAGKMIRRGGKERRKRPERKKKETRKEKETKLHSIKNASSPKRIRGCLNRPKCVWLSAGADGRK
jgi:hypothetical protein